MAGEGGRVNAARVAHWVWGSAIGAQVARIPLIPLSLVYDATMRWRAAGYRRGWFASAHLSLPTVAVGNLSVGGTGKTPLAAWIADRCLVRGRTPGILLRGYGGDEPLVHQRLVPGAVVVADPDRTAGARRAAAAGAQALVLDDAFQLLRVARDLNIAVISADSSEASRWTLPAGPWREGRNALIRADWVVVTRKHAGADAAGAVADDLAGRQPGCPVSVAYLALGRLDGLRSGTRHSATVLQGRRVTAAAGIADPRSFAAQLRDLGARVQLLAYQDHHAYSPGDVDALVRASGEADYVVVTEKDAVKLRGQWPHDAAEPLVAVLTVQWERNRRQLEQALDAALQLPRIPEP
jgi:tetraacyldisaccharide 4'-kinase